MSEEEFVIAIIAMVGGFSLVWGLGYAIFTWFRERRGSIVSPRTLAELREQIAEVQTSVDAIAVEVERVSEGQRFATRLLSERAEAGRVRAAEPER